MDLIIPPKIVSYSYMKSSIPSKRVSSVIVPSSGPSATGGSMFTINIPPTAYFDAARSFLAFDLEITKVQSNTGSLVIDPVRGFPFIEDGIYTSLTNMSNVAGNLTHRLPLDVFGTSDMPTMISNHWMTDELNFSGIADSAAPNVVTETTALVNAHRWRYASYFSRNGDRYLATLANRSVVQLDGYGRMSRPIAIHHKALPCRPDRLQNGIHSLFKRIIIRSQTGVPIEDIQEYNLLASIQRACLQNEEFMHSVGKVEGYGDEHDLARLFNEACKEGPTNTIGAGGSVTYTEPGTGVMIGLHNPGASQILLNPDSGAYGRKKGGVRFCMQPLLGILSTGQSLPLLFMGGITFEFHLEDPTAAFVRGESTGMPVEIFSSLQSRTATIAGAAYTGPFGHQGLIPYYFTKGGVGGVLTDFDDYADTIKPLTFTNLTLIDGNGAPLNNTGALDANNQYQTPFFPLPEISDATRSFTYQLKNIEYHADMVNFSPEFDDSIAQIIQEKGLQIDYTTFTNHHNNIQLTGGSTTITIQDRATSLRGVFCVFRRVSELFGTQAYGYANLENFRKDGIKSYQFRVGTRTVPNQPVRTAGLALEGYESLLMCFNKVPESHISKGDDSLYFGGLNMNIYDYSREPSSNVEEERVSAMTRFTYYHPLLREVYGKDNSALVGTSGALNHFLTHYYNKEGDRFPFSDPIINPKTRFIIAQTFNEHKNLKSGINTAATALPIELVIDIDSSVNSTVKTLYNSSDNYRYDCFVMADRILEIRCGGALTVVY